jgi:hypothetical protein
MRNIIFAGFLFLACSVACQAQFYTLVTDSQYPNQSYVIPPQSSGATPFLKSLHYDNGEPIDLSLWNVEFEMFYGQFDTNGVFQIPGVVSATNLVTYIGATNVWYKPRDYWFSIKATSPEGYITSLGKGKISIEYNPAIGTNVWAQMYSMNIQWLTNWMGGAVGSNTVNIAVLRSQFDATSNQFNNSIGLLTTNLANEIIRATNAEYNISNANVVAVNVVQSNLDIASNALHLAIGVVQSNVDLSSNALYVAVTSEIGRAESAEIALQNNIDTASNTFYTVQTNQAATNSNFDARISAITMGTNIMERYIADNVSNVWVLASGLGVTAVKSSSTFTFTIPSGIHLISARIRIDGGDTDSGVIRLALGTTDVNQSGVSTDWIPTASAYNESSFANVVLVCRPDPDDATLVKVSGLGSVAGTFYSCRFSF